MPGYVLIYRELATAPRIIPMDNRPHPSDRIRNWAGHSVGRWEGDTLVVDTANFNDKAAIQGSGPDLQRDRAFHPGQRRPDLVSGHAGGSRDLDEAMERRHPDARHRRPALRGTRATKATTAWRTSSAALAFPIGRPRRSRNRRFEPGHLFARQLTPLTGLQPAVANRTDRDAPQPIDRMTDRFAHLAHLPVAALVNGDRATSHPRSSRLPGTTSMSAGSVRCPSMTMPRDSRSRSCVVRDAERHALRRHA